MPPPETGQRLIADFAGAVQARVASPAVNCRLQGIERGTGVALEVHFSGAGPDTPAGLLHEVQVFELEGSPGQWLLLAEGRRSVVTARAAQVHCMPLAAFYAVVPPQRLTLGTRLRWALLLTVLRIPGVAYLLKLVRSR